MITKALLLAMIHVESGGNPDAISNKDAKGLMQLTDIGIQEVCLQTRCPDDLDVYDPEDNVWLGYQLLDHYLKVANGDMTGALILYNAGYRGYKRYLDGENMAEETTKYVQLVKLKRKYYASFFARQPWVKPRYIEVIDRVLQRTGIEGSNTLFDAWL